MISSIQRRAVAIVIDYFLFAMFYSMLLVQFGTKTVASDGRQAFELQGYLAIVPVIVWMLTFPVMESFEGQTLGKRIMGLKVVKIDGSRYRGLDALKRRLADWLDFALLGLPALITANNTPYRQRLGDLWARTCVVYATKEDTEATGM